MSIAFYSSPDDENKLLVVVGLGLIGQAISQQLSLYTNPIIQTPQQIKSWSDARKLSLLIKQAINEACAKKLELIWCAGKVGFSATEEETLLENLFFEQVLISLSEDSSIEIKVNLISSAGGLYENSGHVVNSESLSPSRPYAKAKLAQELLLREQGLDHRIYRVSTVYGFGGNRMGLVSVMLRSSIMRRPMIIFANQNTLRDYIFNADLAVAIVNDVIYNAVSGVRILASGRATSIHTLLNIVQRITGRRALHSFRPDGSNDQNITFASNVIYHPFAKRLKVTNLEEGIKLLANQMLINDQLVLSR